MTTTTTETKTKTSCHKPKLLTKAITSNTTPIAMPSISYPTSPIATGSFYLPIKQKNKRNGRYHHKHLRKPPSFDTYLAYSSSSTTQTTCGYPSSSVSSSYSSTSSLVENEELMCGYSSLKSNNLSTTSLSHSPRLRRGSSGYRVRFAEDDGSSIVSSSSGGSSVDDWDVEVDEEEEYILVSQQHSSQRFYGYHEKSSSA